MTKHQNPTHHPNSRESPKQLDLWNLDAPECSLSRAIRRPEGAAWRGGGHQTARTEATLEMLAGFLAVLLVGFASAALSPL